MMCLACVSSSSHHQPTRQGNYTTSMESLWRSIQAASTKHWCCREKGSEAERIYLDRRTQTHFIETRWKPNQCYFKTCCFYISSWYNNTTIGKIPRHSRSPVSSREREASKYSILRKLSMIFAALFPCSVWKTAIFHFHVLLKKFGENASVTCGLAKMESVSWKQNVGTLCANVPVG